MSSIITVVSYENWAGKGHESEFGANTRLDNTLRYTDPAIGWNPNRNNEDAYAEEQPFILRPLYSIFSTAYLSTAEQKTYPLVFIKQIFASFLLLAGVILLIIIIEAIRYSQSQNNRNGRIN